MISVKDALEAIDKISLYPTEVTEPFSADLVGRVLSQDILSPFDLPRFDASAMDGYAVKFGETDDFKVLDAEITAGKGGGFNLNPGEAMRIFTGAPCPATADAVVMQEQTKIVAGRLKVSVPIKLGQNIRRRGEEITKGQTILANGICLNPSAIGLIANFGLTEVDLYKTPQCVILTTGNELLPLGQPLTPGKIYDSNSYMLEAFLKSQHIKEVTVCHVDDDFERTKTKIEEVLEQHDILLISGGISVGDYDYVKEALLTVGVTEVFHTVKQKPGKPLFFGRKDHKFVFGLPGNPASAMNNAYLYVLPLINRFKGLKNTHLPRIKKTTVSDFERRPGRAQFLKAVLSQEYVTLLEGQGSAMLKSFAECNALVYLPEENAGVKQGDVVTVIDLKG